VVIISNQGGISLAMDSKSLKSDKKRLSDFKQKVSAVLGQLDMPVTVFAATERDQYRKPRTGMWQELIEYYDLDEDGPDMEASMFVGDAGGRHGDLDSKTNADFACSDRYVRGKVAKGVDVE